MEQISNAQKIKLLPFDAEQRVPLMELLTIAKAMSDGRSCTDVNANVFWAFLHHQVLFGGDNAAAWFTWCAADAAELLTDVAVLTVLSRPSWKAQLQAITQGMMIELDKMGHDTKLIAETIQSAYTDDRSVLLPIFQKLLQVSMI